MNRGDFAQSYLIAIYHEHRKNPDGRPSVNYIIAHYQVPRDEYFENQVLETLTTSGWVVVERGGDTPNDGALAISYHGRALAEGLIDGGRSVLPLGEVHEIVVPVVHLPIAIPTAKIVNEYDSAQWTGLTSKPITIYSIRSVVSKIRDAEEIIEKHDLSNEHKAQALTYLRVARELAEVAEPPSDIIWQLIERAGAICGVIGLFVTLFLALA